MSSSSPMSMPSLRSRARLAGALYIAYFLFALPLMFRSSLIVPDNAAATAANIVAAEGSYRITMVSDLIGYVVYLALAYLFYTLLREVSRPWAAAATLFTFAGCVVLILATVLLAVPLLLLDGGAFQAFNPAQRQEMALLAVKLFSQCYVVALLLFGFQWLIMGPLFTRLVPRTIGYLLLAGGVAWIAFTAATLLGSTSSRTLQSIAFALGGLSELALGAWLLFRGVEPTTRPAPLSRR